MNLRAAILGAALTAVAAAPAQAQERAHSVSVAQVAAAPARFVDKRVRLRGVIDQCTRYECHICPDARVTDVERCLKLSSWRIAPDPETWIAGDAVRAAGELSALIDQQHRFAEVTLSARLGKVGPREYPPEDSGLIVDYFPCATSRRCGEPGDVFLRDVVVEQVHARTASVLGLMTKGYQRPLSPASPEQDRALREAFGKDFSQPHPQAVRTFVFEPDRRGFLCVWKHGGWSEDEWPKRLGDVLRNPLDQHHCWEASNVKAWVFDQESFTGEPAN